MILSITLFLEATTVPGHGAILDWKTGQALPGTESIVLRPGMELSFWGAPSKNLRYANLAHFDLAGSDFRSSWLDYADFSGANLAGVGLSHSKLTNVNLAGATITRAAFGSTTSRGFTKEQLYATASYKIRNLSGVDLRENDLTDWDFSGQTLTDAIFDGAKLKNTNFAEASLTGACFYFSMLAGADLSRANISDAKFKGAVLRKANLTDATIAGADFSNTYNPVFKEQSFTKVQLYSTADYKKGNLSGLGLGADNLSGWDFSHQNLTGVDFTDATLANANFTDAIVTRANLTRTLRFGFTKEQFYSTASYKNKELPGISLHEDDVTGWDLSYQNLATANFESTKLIGVNLTGARLTGVNFNSAKLDNAILELADLRGAFGVHLDTPGLSLRGAILPDGTVSPFALNAGETWRVQPAPKAVTLNGAITMSANSTIEIAGSAVQQKAGTALTLNVPNRAHLIVRDGGSLTLEKIVLAPGSRIDGDGIITATIITADALPSTIHRGP